MIISQKALDASQSLFSRLDKHWIDDTHGMGRSAWSNHETEAMQTLYGFAHDTLNMQIWEDLVGNIYMMPKGAENSQAPVRMVGSHVDAVKNGGRYDGPAGVIAPLTALYQAKLNGDIIPPNTVITIWRNEESPWLNQFAVGSKFAAGALTEEFLTNSKHTEFGYSLHDILNQNFNGNGDKLLEKLRSDDPKLIGTKLIEGIVETHIEQGYQLEKANKSLGFVTSVRGNVRFPDMIDFHGNAGHSGTVPQNDRCDANEAMAEFIIRTRNIFREYLKNGADIVWSYPQTKTIGGATSTIPPHAQLTPEVRSTDPAMLKHAAMAFRKVVQDIEKETGVRVSFNKMNVQPPVDMSKTIHRELSGIAMNSGLHDDIIQIPSGAGHDVQVLAEAGINAGLIFIRHGNRGASHRPDEILGRTPHDNPFKIGSDFANAVIVNHGWMTGRSPLPNRCDTPFLRDLENRGARHII